MNSAEVKCGSFRGDCFSRGNIRDDRNHHKEEDKDEHFVPKEGSKWSKYKTKWWHRYEN